MGKFLIFTVFTLMAMVYFGYLCHKFGYVSGEHKQFIIDILFKTVLPAGAAFGVAHVGPQVILGAMLSEYKRVILLAVYFGPLLAVYFGVYFGYLQPLQVPPGAASVAWFNLGKDLVLLAIAWDRLGAAKGSAAEKLKEAKKVERGEQRAVESDFQFGGGEEAAGRGKGRAGKREETS